eukprot:TRINITY_DN8939_c0_g2_i4.p1 TRINITY_DN8939_c0_g2~~TRINITY_DN8939_c0_g2_i4.p1  ORF type:complete len:376 (+),score=59.72 TRINITY_DN8939_c0_g2_i4:3-1130(+)
MARVFQYLASILVLLTLQALRVECKPADSPCGFESYYPRQYISYHTSSPPVIDGRLDDQAWHQVAWTEPFVDISGFDYPAPRYETKAKFRHDDTYVYVAGYLEEPQIWATLTEHDSVIFNDNDFEVFFDADRSSRYYKEYEMNALNTSWSLCLNHPYLNGGYENSSRVFGKQGWDDDGLRSGVYIDGKLNNPSATNRYWTVEIAFPLAHIAYNTTAKVPVLHNTLWHFDLSRVEWHVKVVDGQYVKLNNTAEDNWVYAPTFAVDIHLPEFWANLQFSNDNVNTTRPLDDPEWTLRFLAMQLYEAQQGYKNTHGAFTDQLALLAQFTPVPGVLNRSCTASINVKSDGDTFIATLISSDTARQATIRQSRELRVTKL